MATPTDMAKKNNTVEGVFPIKLLVVVDDKPVAVEDDDDVDSDMVP